MQEGSGPAPPRAAAAAPARQQRMAIGKGIIPPLQIETMPRGRREERAPQRKGPLQGAAPRAASCAPRGLPRVRAAAAQARPFDRSGLV